MFSRFSYQKKTGPTISHLFRQVRKDDYIIGGDPIVGPGQAIGDQTVRADNAVWTSDSTNFTVDNS